MSTGMDLPWDLDEWIVLPIFSALWAVQVQMIGLQIRVADFTLSDTIGTWFGGDWTVAALGVTASSVIAGLSYGWLARAKNDQDWETDQTIVVAIAIGLPLAWTFDVGIITNNLGGSDIGIIAAWVLGAAAMAFATLKIDDENPLLGQLLGDD